MEAANAIYYGVGLSTLLITLFCVYQVTLHPLAKYPGPLLAKFSKIPLYLHTAAGDSHLNLLQQHKKYGPVVRIAPDQLSFSEPAALRDIYQPGRASNPLRKGGWYRTLTAPSGGSSLHSETSRRKHAFRRRIIEIAFSDSALRSLEPYVIENIDILLSQLTSSEKPSAKWSKAVNMSNLASWFAYDVMGDIVFGRHFDCLRKPDHRYVPDLLMAGSSFIFPAGYLPCQWLVRRFVGSPTLMGWFGGQAARDEHAYVEYAKSCIADRIATAGQDQGRQDIMSHVLSARDPVTNQPLSRKDLVGDSGLMIAAGADTTSTTLAAALFYLTLPGSKSYLDDLTQDLRSSYQTLESIRGPQIVSNRLLRAIIDETLRLSPSVLSQLPRDVVQKPGITIASRFIPAGTVVGCSAYVLQHDETAFPHPEQFLPERWAADKEALSSSVQHPDQVALAREAFCAFSLGSRGCVGKALAYMGLSIALGRIIWSYDLRRAGNAQQVTVRTLEEGRQRGWTVREDEYQLKDYFLAERNGPMIEFRRRD